MTFSKSIKCSSIFKISLKKGNPVVNIVVFTSFDRVNAFYLIDSDEYLSDKFNQ